MDTAGDGGTFKPGKDVTLKGGADMGWFAYGLVGTAAGNLWLPHLHEQSVSTLLAVEGAESCAGSSSGVELPDADLFVGIIGD